MRTARRRPDNVRLAMDLPAICRMHSRCFRFRVMKLGLIEKAPVGWRMRRVWQRERRRGGAGLIGAAGLTPVARGTRLVAPSIRRPDC